MTPKSRSSDIEVVGVVTKPKEKVPRIRICWINVVVLVYLHIGAFYGLNLFFTSAKWQTNSFAAVLCILSELGITAGAHRLWSHRSYKAKLPLRILLAFFNTIAFQKDIYDWARDHRVHHKHSDTDADPYNASRGFFFSHVGWLLCRKHPNVFEKGQGISLKDVIEDPVVNFQRRHYLPLIFLFCFTLPTVIPMYFWGETFSNGYFVCAVFRLVLTLHQTWLINSAAHMWGNRPYDIAINPRENYFVVFWAIGEGFHNYHHTFPYDYAASEFGFRFNLTTMFIDLMAFLGQAYDLKSVPAHLVQSRKDRTGEKVSVKKTEEHFVSSLDRICTGEKLDKKLNKIKTIVTNLDAEIC